MQAGEGGAFRPRPPAGFQFFMEFQSHEAEFDYLKSMEIEEKINEIAWCPSSGGSLFMLTTNGEEGKRTAMVMASFEVAA